MNGQLNSLESFDSGSNYRFGDKMIHSNIARSLFDLSHLNTLTIPRAGMLIPITWFETLPRDDHDITVDCLLRVLPQVVPLYSRQRLYVYAFYSRYSDLWCNWQVFMDKGYTGNDNRKIPTLHHGSNTPTKNNLNWDTNTSTVIQANTIFDYLGIPINAAISDLFSTDNNNPTAKISALPFMMYLRIYRDYFMNKNHWVNDRVMLPDDDSRFRLNDDGILLSALDQNKDFRFYITSDKGFDLSVSGSTYYFSGCMHDYPDDYFTSAIPWPQRGTVATITTTGSITGSMDFTNAVATSQLTPTQFGNFTVQMNNDSSDPKIIAVDSTGNYYDNGLLTALNKGRFSGNGIALAITLNQLRNLAIDQQMMEQLARTDGSYFQFGLSFFGEPSKAAYDYRPTYIGGTYKNIAFTEVLQTATTQTTQSGQTVDNPAGAYVGHGITGISNGRIGHIHCDDYGMIMLLACVMPDVYYHQGIDKTFTEQTQEEKFLPDRALLGMQPILNKEIYYAGNNGSSAGQDNYLWAYQNPFDHLRYIPNKIHGKIADPNALSFFPYTQARQFTQLPNWGRSFSSTNDVRKDYLTAPTEDAYTAQFSMNIRSVRPLPYKATPAKLVHM